MHETVSQFEGFDKWAEYRGTVDDGGSETFVQCIRQDIHVSDFSLTLWWFAGGRSSIMDSYVTIENRSSNVEEVFGGETQRCEGIGCAVIADQTLKFDRKDRQAFHHGT